VIGAGSLFLRGVTKLAALTVRTPSFKRPASETLHTSGLMRRNKTESYSPARVSGVVGIVMPIALAAFTDSASMRRVSHSARRGS
jgi:hypothetical protein